MAENFSTALVSPVATASDRLLFFTSNFRMVANATTMPKLLLLTRIAIILALAIFQFIYFGMPAWEKYSRAVVGEAKIIEKHDSLRSHVDPMVPTEDGLRPPAITLCPFKYNFRGWKQATIQTDIIDKVVNDQSYNQWCESANSTADFENCIEKETFSLNDTVIAALVAAGKDLTGPEFWSSDVSLSLFGRCYTMHLDVKLGANALTSIILSLNPNMTYQIFFHQLDIFYPTFNPVALAEASVRRTLSIEVTGNQFVLFTLELVRRERLNRAENPCNPDIGYKFSRCIKQSVSDTIGCKLPWDKHTEGFITGNCLVMFQCVIIIFCCYRTQSLFYQRPCGVFPHSFLSENQLASSQLRSRTF